MSRVEDADRVEGGSLADRFCEFFSRYYRDDIGTLAQNYPSEQKSLLIAAEDLCQYDPDMFDDWIAAPAQLGEHALAGLKMVDLPSPIDLGGVNIRLTDSASYIPTRGVSELTSDDIGGYIGITGNMSKVTGVKSRLTEALFECQRCATPNGVVQPRTALQTPHKCTGCEREGPFLLDPAQSSFVDQRKVKFETPPDEGTPGQTQSITVYVDDDLCHTGGENGLPDRAGERVTFYGELKIDESQFDARNASPELDTWFDAQAVAFEQDGFEDLDVDAHRPAFEEFAKRPDAVDLCAKSIAPELQRSGGDDLANVTEAAVAWLFNAYRLDPDGMGQKRGDIHMGIFGDPGLGKSTLLSDLAKLAPKCEFRSGTGLSSVGLTAAAVQEEFAGTTEWTLEPGVLPRANGGHCIIDEVDDVVDEKTKKMHDALEGDQMVKIDKAGISADLPTRTALLISGNPAEGRFDRYTPLAPQIKLDPALISRLDLLFAMQDTVDRDADRDKAQHILDSYDELSAAELKSRGIQNTTTTNSDTTTDDGDGDGDGADNTSPTRTKRPVPIDVFRAWILHAREHVYPTLTPEAKARLKEFYLETRNLNDGHDGGDDTEPIPATPRSLESGIRLATAFARVHLSDTVEIDHAERAVAISKQVVGVNFDPNNNTFDSGRTDTGNPKSQQERLKRLTETIRAAQDEFEDESGVPHSDLNALLSDDGYPTNRLDSDIEKLRKDGQIYTPDQGVYRAT